MDGRGLVCAGGGAGTGHRSVQIKEGRPAEGEQKTWSGSRVRHWKEAITGTALQEEAGACRGVWEQGWGKGALALQVRLLVSVSVPL